MDIEELTLDELYAVKTLSASNLKEVKSFKNDNRKRQRWQLWLWKPFIRRPFFKFFKKS